MIKNIHLRRIQMVAGSVFAAVMVLLIANSLFLFMNKAPDELVALMVRVHLWLGWALWLAFGGFFLSHFSIKRHHVNLKARVFGLTVLVTLLLGMLTGVGLFIVGKSSQTRWLTLSHEITFLVAIVLYVSHRLSARVAPPMRWELSGALAALLLAVGLWSVGRNELMTYDDAGKPADSESTLAQMGLSRAQIVSGHWLDEGDLANPEYCAQCHTEIAEQWEGSAHRFSSFNDPFYKATFDVLQKHRDDDQVKFCGGCHDPLVLLTGNMKGELGPESTHGESGITCLTCHAVTGLRDRIGNAAYIIAPPDHYPFYGSNDPDEQEQNRNLIRSKPEKHKASFMKAEMHRTSEFCLVCHKAHLDPELNNYKQLPGQNDYDAWRESQAALESARTFYQGGERRNCQFCHMKDIPTNDPAAKDGLSRDHQFASANTALATVKDKAEWLRKAEELLKGCVQVDIFAAVVEPQDPNPVRIYPLEDVNVRVPVGKELQVEVVLTNTGVGHLFPGGTGDLQEPWVEFVVAKRDGTPILASGMLDKYHRVDPSAHKLDILLLTREGRRVDIHNVEDVYTRLYNNGIPLGASDVIRYVFTVPDLPAGEKLSLSAILHYRKFNRPYTEFVLGPEAPEFPIVPISGDTVFVTLGGTARGAGKEQKPDFERRLYRYGVANFRQAGTGLALQTFRAVTELNPKNADAFVNIARVHLVDGSLAEVEPALKAADQVQPGFFKTAYFLGRLRSAQGRFAEAVAAYDVVLTTHPQDLMAHLDKGVALYKSGQVQPASLEFAKALDIEPEDVTAHSYLSLCYTTLGDAEKARKHEALYLKFKEDDYARSVQEIHRRNDLHADREANQRHVHPLTPVTAESVPASSTQPVRTAENQAKLQGSPELSNLLGKTAR